VLPGRRSANGRHRRVEGCWAAVRPAGCQLRRGGSIAGRKELAGDDRLLDSEHQFAKGKRREGEKLTASSTRCFAGVEERRVGLTARGKVLGLRRDPDWRLL